MPSSVNVTSSKIQIQYLGHVITKDGISIDPDKIKAINEWSVPKDVTDVWLFMGITGYYQGSLKVSQES